MTLFELVKQNICVPDAVETVEAAVDAAVLLFIRTPRSLLRIV